MSSCCINGCGNRYSNTNGIHFYRIPFGSGPFQRNRRRLWLQALKRVDWKTTKYARICSVHFISGKPSMDFESPDFVPSIFVCTKQIQRPEAKLKRSPCKTRRQRLCAKGVNSTLKTTVSRLDFNPEVLHSSVPKETTGNELSQGMATTPTASTEGEILTEATNKTAEVSEVELLPAPHSTSKEGETLTKEVEDGTKTAAYGIGCINAAPVANKTNKPEKLCEPKTKLPSFKVPSGIAKPLHVLVPPAVPPGGFHCEVCNQHFYSFPQAMRHKQFHNEERPFPCAVCGKRFLNRSHHNDHQRIHTGERPFPCELCVRSFTTNHNLKRHQKIHTKEDTYRCRKCGILFCERHKANWVQSNFEPKVESELETPVAPPNPSNDLKLENDVEQKLEQTSELISADTQSTLTAIPMSNISPSLDTHTEISSQTNASPPPYPNPPSRTSLAQPPHPITSFQIFAPQSLTSAFLEVKRNYEYLLDKTSYVKKKKKKKKTKNNVNEEQSESSSNSQEEQSDGQHKLQRIAYDIEVVL